VLFPFDEAAKKVKGIDLMWNRLSNRRKSWEWAVLKLDTFWRRRESRQERPVIDGQIGKTTGYLPAPRIRGGQIKPLPRNA
jgi:hypothetical protein